MAGTAGSGPGSGMATRLGLGRLGLEWLGLGHRLGSGLGLGCRLESRLGLGSRVLGLGGRRAHCCGAVDRFRLAPPPEPTVYVERERAATEAPPAPAAEQWWYWCASARGYYPYVGACPEGWQRVVPQVPTAPQ